jgi:methyl-accepting chemotaxis protein
VWVKDDNKSYLGQVTLVNPADSGVPADQWHFYSKNPALAQREFSEVVEKSTSPAKFRMTSHNFMNPVNKPDAFEAKALDKVRTGRLGEYYEFEPDGFRYARTLYEKASCLACHASAASAPNDVKERYGVEHGYGFKEGEVAGIISVRLPVRSFWQVTSSVIGPIQIGLLAGAFLISFLFIQFAVVRPLRKLTVAAERISTGQAADLGATRIHRRSGNEVRQLVLAVERLRASMTMAIQRVGRRPPPT